MRRQFRGQAVGGFFAGAEGAFAGEAVEVVAGEFERGVRMGELFAEGGHFAQAARRKLRDADIPANEVDEQNFAAAFGEILFDDFAGLLLEGIVVRIKATAPGSVPKKYSGHARACRATIWRAEMLHFDFGARDNVWCESVTGVGSIGRFRKRDRRVDNF